MFFEIISNVLYDLEIISYVLDDLTIISYVLYDLKIISNALYEMSAFTNIKCPSSAEGYKGIIDKKKKKEKIYQRISFGNY